ncbi:hypothetical protein B0J12DRAFT_660846 [Macrophomina phaseolina]|uniref:Uncharacterized protein n=1 Tax=Macrophomina phaseolina TaxID=35725 RepID=A0ABQ8GFZ3_9PEZI|nr:hypothetical protein B0J12DRAFT_660846 [Macrophomina phaseolina]
MAVCIDGTAGRARVGAEVVGIWWQRSGLDGDGWMDLLWRWPGAGAWWNSRCALVGDRIRDCRGPWGTVAFGARPRRDRRLWQRRCEPGSRSRDTVGGPKSNAEGRSLVISSRGPESHLAFLLSRLAPVRVGRITGMATALGDAGSPGPPPMHHSLSIQSDGHRGRKCLHRRVLLGLTPLHVHLQLRARWPRRSPCLCTTQSSRHCQPGRPSIATVPSTPAKPRNRLRVHPPPPSSS